MVGNGVVYVMWGLVIAGLVVPFALILRRMGFSPFWAILMMFAIPMAPIMFWVLALTKWPVEQQK